MVNVVLNLLQFAVLGEKRSGSACKNKAIWPNAYTHMRIYRASDALQ
jgi:hypothetical protein